MPLLFKKEPMNINKRRIAVNRPIGVGLGYSTIAYIPEQSGSWALPLLHERISSSQTAISQLSQQLRQVCSKFDQKPILVVDSRFTIEHWYRFAKQRLHWTLPNLCTTEQCDRWSDLIPMMTWKLWLASEILVDNPLPWQKPQINLTPGRVAQNFGTVIATIGTPTCFPQPRGKSPGWQKGKMRTKKTRYPIVKKSKGRFESQKQAAKRSKSA